MLVIEAWWSSREICVMLLEGSDFESDPDCYVATLGRLLTP